MYDLCMFIGCLVSITQLLKDTLFGLEISVTVENYYYYYIRVGWGMLQCN
jgi:hypothetical protein